MSLDAVTPDDPDAYPWDFDLFGEPAPEESVTEESVTDPLWYLLAAFLAPHMAHSNRLVWIEGFVSALEAAKGVGTTLDISGTIRDSL